MLRLFRARVGPAQIQKMISDTAGAHISGKTDCASRAVARQRLLAVKLDDLLDVDAGYRDVMGV